MGASSPSTHCPACGQAQTNHLALWLTSTSDVFTLWMPAYNLPFYDFLSRVGNMLASFLGRIAIGIGSVLGIIKATDDIETAISNRSRLLWQEAKKRGIHMEHLLFFGKPSDTFRVKNNGKTEYFKSLPFPPFNIDALRMDDKVLFKKAMRKENLPVPLSFSASNMAAAMKALEAVKIACVKPRSGSNARHTSPYVTTEDQLRDALTSVKQICTFASVEEQLEGNVCRATCVGGTLIGFLESQYPAVVGDGTSTVQELVAKVNTERPEGVGEIIVDDSHIGYIGRRGYTLDSVLPEGKRLPLTYRAGSLLGGSNREHGRTIHPSFIEPIERAARMTGLTIVGFDLIVPDPFIGADEQKWGFIEANSLPWIDLHATPFYGDPIDLSPFVWDQWEKSARGIR